MQNQILLTQLISKTASPRDPMAALMTEEAGSSSALAATGARGCVARESYTDLVQSHPEVFLKEFRKLLAREMEVSPADLQPAMLRGYFERRVPLGNMKTLTYQAFLVAELWRLAEQGDWPQLHAQLAAGAVFLEQAAMDEGRLEVGWLFTGLLEPPFNITNQNSKRKGAQSFAHLAHPRWLAANLAYLKDLDFFDNRAAPKTARPGGKFGAGGKDKNDGDDDGGGAPAKSNRPKKN